MELATDSLRPKSGWTQEELDRLARLGQERSTATEAARHCNGASAPCGGKHGNWGFCSTEAKAAPRSRVVSWWGPGKHPLDPLDVYSQRPLSLVRAAIVVSISWTISRSRSASRSNSARVCLSGAVLPNRAQSSASTRNLPSVAISSSIPLRPHTGVKPGDVAASLSAGHLGNFPGSKPFTNSRSCGLHTQRSILPLAALLASFSAPSRRRGWSAVPGQFMTLSPPRSGAAANALRSFPSHVRTPPRTSIVRPVGRAMVNAGAMLPDARRRFGVA
jgi:hypothetical protein